MVDLVAQGVGGSVLEGLLQFWAGQPLLAKLRLELRAAARQFAAGDDVVVHFGDDLFDGAYVGRRACGDGGRE